MSGAQPLTLTSEEAKQYLKHMADRIRDCTAGAEQGRRWLHDATRTPRPTQEVMFVTDESVYRVRLSGTHHLATHVQPLGTTPTPPNAVAASEAFATTFLESATKAFDEDADRAAVRSARTELEHLGMSQGSGVAQHKGASDRCPLGDMDGPRGAPNEVGKVIP